MWLVYREGILRKRLLEWLKFRKITFQRESQDLQPQHNFSLFNTFALSAYISELLSYFSVMKPFRLIYFLKQSEQNSHKTAFFRICCIIVRNIEGDKNFREISKYLVRMIRFLIFLKARLHLG